MLLATAQVYRRLGDAEEEEYPNNRSCCSTVFVARTGRSERDDLVIVGDQRPDARVAIVVIERHHPCIGDGVLDPERARTVVTDRGVVADGLVQVVVVAVLVFEFGDPLRSGAVEDEFDTVAVGLCELFRGLETVDEATGVLGPLRPCEDKHRCFCHCVSLYGPQAEKDTPTFS